MNLHLLTHEFFPRRGGAASYVDEVARAAHAIGHRVTIYAPRHSALPRAAPGPVVVPLPVSGTQGWKDRLALRRFFQQEISPALGPDDILHLAEAGPLGAAVYLLPWMSIPTGSRLVLTFHGSELLRYSRFPLQRKLLKRLVTRAQAVHVLSREVERLLLDRFPCAKEKTLRLPGAPRSAALRPPPGNPEPRPTRPASCLRILSVGRIHPRKGQHALFEALHLLPEPTRSGVEVWMVGPVVRHRYFDYCTRLAQTAGVRTRFIHGASDRMIASLYSQADIFVLTSLPAGRSIEGFGLVCVEAASFELPVVAHRVGGVEDAVAEGSGAFLVPHDDRTALARALKVLIDDPDKRRAMGISGANFARKLSWSSVVRGLYPDPG